MATSSDRAEKITLYRVWSELDPPATEHWFTSRPAALLHARKFYLMSDGQLVKLEKNQQVIVYLPTEDNRKIRHTVRMEASDLELSPFGIATALTYLPFRS